MANAIESEGEKFLSRLQTAREEVRNRFSSAQRLLQEREAALLQQLQEIEDSYKQENSKLIVQKNVLLKTREQLQATLKGNENQTTLQSMLDPLNAKLREIEKEEELQRIELNWSREGELEYLLKEMGTIKLNKDIIPNKKDAPVLTACKYRENTTRSGEFKWPTVIAVHSNTNLYIIDPLNNRVQVFDKYCTFLFAFSGSMNHPAGICFHDDLVYVTQSEADKLNVYSTNGAFVESIGSRGDKKLQFKSPVRMCISETTNTIYICDKDNNRVQILNVNLTFNSFITKLVFPRDVKVTTDEIFILDKQNPCLHVFNHRHQLLHELISFGGKNSQIQDSYHFCLSTNSNILFTDTASNCVVVFSKGGEHIHKLGKKGKKEGEFLKPRGIAIGSEGRIIVASNNPEHCIQFFLQFPQN
ncbi:PEP-CTERM domain protein [Oopsacas minuta]|uniref:PEP-CTERM domain protein n=1 Tax=Oopsacas minuta TaxID=111878 RepID=A0AAV7K5T4_9METZ|nr:PEP-CTERM domain protein [Oopsacas minuta]